MDAGRLSICGEESFGTGSDHIREKDGLWAVIGTSGYHLPFFLSTPVLVDREAGLDVYWTIAAWLNILAEADKQGVKGVSGVLLDHYKKYGRTFFSRYACFPLLFSALSLESCAVLTLASRSYDYEEVESDSAAKVIKELESAFSSSSFVGSTLTASSGRAFKVAESGNFTYTDPIDHSVSKNQGLYVTFDDGSRFVVRLSGTGSQGATIRLYAEKYSKDEKEYEADTQEGLKPLIEVALTLSKLVEHTGRKEPTVSTLR